MSTEKRPKKSQSTIKKQDFNLNDFKKSSGLDNSVKEKPLSVIPLSDAFFEATGNAGIYQGYTNIFQGWPETGKSTGMFECISSCQKLGILPIIIDTEGNFNWDYARNVGIEFQEVVDEDGVINDYEGFFIFMNGRSILNKYGKFKHDEGKEGRDLRSEPCVEDIAMFINDIIDRQTADELPYDLCFIWDSIGSISSYRSIVSKSKNNQWDAGAISNSFNSILNFKIPSSRMETSKYTNTFLAVQKIWYDGMNNVVRPKGGNTFTFGGRFICHYGNTITPGTSKLKAASGNKTFYFGTECKIKVIKNQINGVSYEGKIASTPHGYWNPDKIDEYKKQYKSYLLEKLETNSEDLLIMKEDYEESEG